MSRANRLLSGIALGAASAAFVMVAVATDWPLLRLGPAATSAEAAACASSDCNALGRGLSHYVGVAQAALEKMLPSLRDERRLPEAGADRERESTPASPSPASGAASSPVTSRSDTSPDAQDKAKELARQLARDLASQRDR